MNSVTDPAKRDRWARLRFSIVGPLLAAPPAAGELQAALVALAAKSWRHPLADKEICFGVSTLERWYSVVFSFMWGNRGLNEFCAN